jgi:hypothetical protein
VRGAAPAGDACRSRASRRLTHPRAHPHFSPQATVEAIKHRGVLKLTLLALDILPTPGTRAPDTILVSGSEDRLHVRGQLRGFLQTERAQYISQDAENSDEAILAVQEEVERNMVDKDGKILSDAVAEGPKP